jgi:hypothetical protein
MNARVDPETTDPAGAVVAVDPVGQVDLRESLHVGVLSVRAVPVVRATSVGPIGHNALIVRSVPIVAGALIALALIVTISGGESGVSAPLVQSRTNRFIPRLTRMLNPSSSIAWRGESSRVWTKKRLILWRTTW